MTFKSLNGLAPQYMTDMLDQYVPVRQLRSSCRNLLKMPSAKYKKTERAFSVIAPKLWNTIPDELRIIAGPELFKKRLKTYLFNQAF